MPSWSQELRSRPPSSAAAPPVPAAAAPQAVVPPPPPRPDDVPAAASDESWRDRLWDWCSDDAAWSRRCSVAGVTALVVAVLLAAVRPPFVLDEGGARSWRRIAVVSTLWAVLVLALPVGIRYWRGE